MTEIRKQQTISNINDYIFKTEYMDAYVINLKNAPHRREYVRNVLKHIASIQINWIEAIDGRILSMNQTKTMFDLNSFRNHYMRLPRAGEIGCTLSHQDCYQKLIKSNNKSVIILEDDIVLNSDITQLIPKIETFLDSNEPRLILLSGWFWFNKKLKFTEKINICKVFDGYLTHAYALNREAAKLMICEKPHYLADAWELYIKKGVQIYGLSPHPIDQDWSGVFKSDVLSEKVSNSTFNLSRWVDFKIRGLKQRIFKALKKFEAPQNLANRIGDIKDHMDE